MLDPPQRSIMPSSPRSQSSSAPSIPPNVQSATSALQSAVQSFLTKQRKKRLQRHGAGAEGRMLLPVDEERTLARHERDARRAAAHGSHILHCLAVKRQALALGVAALEGCADQCLAALKKHFAPSSSGTGGHDELQSILAHYFTNYLRLRDGLVLLTSGECRHAGDIKQASSSSAAAAKYKSSFGTDSTGRGDGYTTLFSAEGGYSGYGWDEFYNEDLGVRTRLADACLGCAGSKPSPSRGWGGNRAKVWDRLLELGGEAFESELDIHEAETKATEGRLEKVRQQFLNGINAILTKTERAKGGSGGGVGRGGKLSMVTTDKFERLELQNATSLLGISRLVIERRGDDFCVCGDGGVLPNYWDERAWTEVMKLPKELTQVAEPSSKGTKCNSAKSARCERSSTATCSAAAGVSMKRKRRIIEDNDSDTDEDKQSATISRTDARTTMQTKKPKEQKSNCVATAPGGASKFSGGLKVKVKSIDTDSSPATGDITKIKSSLGVDVEALARGREDLEVEQKHSAAAAVAEEVTTAGVQSAALVATTITRDDEDSARSRELLETIGQLREDIKGYEKILRLVGDSKAEDLWNARESLRELKMTLGSELLELYAIATLKMGDDVEDDCRATLKYAEALFSDSVNLVSDQFNDFERATKTEDEDTQKAMRRGLLLLRGRARTNQGIVLTEQAKLEQYFQRSAHAIGDGTRGKSNAKTTLLKAMQYLSKAAEDAHALHATLVSSIGGSDAEKSKADQDICDARVLETLVKRRQGDALWLLGRKKDGARKFEEAAYFERDEEELVHAAASSTGLEMYLAYLLERYYATTSLIDHATAAAEEVPIGKASSAGDEVITMASKGYDLAASISESIALLAEKTKFNYSFIEIKEENDLSSKLDLLKAKADVEKWWEKRKYAKPSVNPLKNCFRVDRSRMHREYLARSLFPSQPLTARKTISDTGAKTRNSNNQDCRPNGTRGSCGPNRRALASTPAVKPSSCSADASDPFEDVSSLFCDFAANGQTPTVYRKWGDELLPHTNVVDGTLQVPYPSCAPELPPDDMQQ